MQQQQQQQQQKHNAEIEKVFNILNLKGINDLSIGKNQSFDG
jgi:hypothetical protein